jgi:hypothetical protein
MKNEKNKSKKKRLAFGMYVNVMSSFIILGLEWYVMI